MSRDWRLYLDDILESCEKIQRFTAGMDPAAFLADDRTFDAVIRNLEIIGEAARHIPDEVRAPQRPSATATDRHDPQVRKFGAGRRIFNR